METSKTSPDYSYLRTPTRLDIICESGGNRTDGLNKTLTQNTNLCAGSSHFVTSLISSFTGARGRYLRKAIIPAQQQPLPLGLCTFKISHNQKPAGRSPAPVTCCLQILRNRVYHGFRCYLISAQNQHHHLGYSLQPLPADDGEDSVCSTFIWSPAQSAIRRAPLCRASSEENPGVV